MRPIFFPHEFFRPRAPAAVARDDEAEGTKPILAPHELFHHEAPAAAAATVVRDEESDEEPIVGIVGLEMSDFQVIGELGGGLYNVVYKARLRRCPHGGVFALKTPYYDLGGREEDEAVAAVLRRVEGLEHVVRCHAMFRRNESLRVAVFEHMNGGSLDRALSRRGGRGLPEPALAEVAAACLAALRGLHSRGVVHLHLNPFHILADADGNIKICDFDDAKIIPPGPGSTVYSGIGFGSPEYMSPERCAPMAMAGARVARAADVWSLGITVLHLYQGHCPARPLPSKRTLERLSYEISHGEPPSVPDEDTRASIELRGFVSACLQKCVCTRATVAELLNHPFVAERDVAESRRVLKEVIVATMDKDDY
uniref:Protein kinase domain-containing protein n=1 Tax=Oryza glumipatula TaxID=40148 RepID=A0A0D9Y6X4_9ORYZ